MAKARKSKVTYNMKQLRVALKDEQIDAQNMIKEHAVSVLWGKAGCGKTLVAVYTALEMMLQKDLNRIIITRPTISDEDLGFLPGDIDDKMDPWMAPIYENMRLAVGSEATEAFIAERRVEIKPLSYMRGQTFTDAAIIVDEAQNITHSQMEMLLGRLGRRSRMMICGDMKQKDLKSQSTSGLPFLMDIAKKIPEVCEIELKINHRHKVVQKILELYDNK